MSVENLKCKECGAEYELGASYFCEQCFGPLEVTYAHFLPFAGRPGDPLEPGLTPLLRADRLAERLGVEAEIWVKNDAANPTHSFKDRVVAVAIAKAQEL